MTLAELRFAVAVLDGKELPLTTDPSEAQLIQRYGADTVKAVVARFDKEEWLNSKKPIQDCQKETVIGDER